MSFTWAAMVVVGVPLLVIAASEVDERLRQRESPLRPALSVFRLWSLPLFAAWALLVPVLDVEADSPLVVAVTSALVLTVTIGALRLLRVGVDAVRTRPRAEGRGPVPQLVLALPRIALLLVASWFLVGVVWGVNLSAALTALGVTSLVVSFALQDTLSGLASGFLLLSDQPFEPGDWIRVEDTEGLVVDLNWRTARIRTRNGDLIVVPNSTLAKASIINYSKPESLHRVVYSVQVAFVNPPTVAKNMLLDAARGTPGVLTEPPPNVRVVQTDDPLMTYEVDLWVSDFSIEPQVKSDFGSLVWYQSERQGVPLPSPAHDLFLHDVTAEAVARTDEPAAMEAALRRSALLAMLDDDEIERLVQASRRVRFAAGELMIDGTAGRRDLMVILSGTATMVLLETGRGDEFVTELGAGETVGVLEGPRGEGRLLAVRARTDCEVVVIDAEAAGEVASRNAELAAALNRLGTLRRRRLDRVLERRLAPGGDGNLAAAPDGSAPT